MLPTLLMGYPYDVPYTVKTARILAETGVITDTSLHMLVTIIAALQPFAWSNVNAWIALSIGAFSLSLAPLWWSIRMLFDKRVAWYSTIVVSMLPISWLMANAMSGYCFALLPLFLSFGVFIKFREKHPNVAILLSAIFFGMTLGIQHSYLAFLPWYVIAYLWNERKHLLSAVIRTGLFCVTAYCIFLLPMVPGAMQSGLTPSERLTLLLSPMEQSTPGEGHLYPDEFIFNNYREEYNKEMEEQISNSSFLKRQENRNYRIIFGTDSFSILDRISTSLWLVLNNIPQYFAMDFMGGAFLWLFIVPGIVIAWRTRRMLVLLIAGLILTMEFLLRFYLLFTSSHIDNYMWVIALFAGLGMSAVVEALTRSWKLRPKQSVLLIAFVALTVGFQLLQADRKVLAHRYSRSSTPEIYAATEALNEIPSDAVVAAPRRHDLLILSPHSYVSVHPATMDFLARRGKLAEPFTKNGVTHILGYSDEQVAMITKAVPKIKVIKLSETRPPLSTVVRYILNTIR